MAWVRPHYSPQGFIGLTMPKDQSGWWITVKIKPRTSDPVSLSDARTHIYPYMMQIWPISQFWFAYRHCNNRLYTIWSEMHCKWLLIFLCYSNWVLLQTLMNISSMRGHHLDHIKYSLYWPNIFGLGDWLLCSAHPQMICCQAAVNNPYLPYLLSFTYSTIICQHRG